MTRKDVKGDQPSGGETTWTNTGATRYGRGQRKTGSFGDDMLRPSPNHGTQRLPNDDDVHTSLCTLFMSFFIKSSHLSFGLHVHPLPSSMLPLLCSPMPSSPRSYPCFILNELYLLTYFYYICQAMTSHQDVDWSLQDRPVG